MYPVNKDNLFQGMNVQDIEGRKGIVRDCVDLHNVHVTFEGEGIEIDWYGDPFICGGSVLYCFEEDCKENCKNEYPLSTLYKIDYVGLIEDIESLKQAAKFMRITNDITPDGFNSLNIGLDALIESVNRNIKGNLC